MNCVGIDISKGKSMIAVMRPFGEVVVSPFEVLHTDSELSKLARLLKSLDGETRVVMESTGNYHAPVAWLLHDAGLYVSVVNAMLVHDYGNNSLRRAKTDKKDAVKLANYGLDHWLTLPRYVPEEDTRLMLKSCYRQYQQYSKVRTMLKNNLISLLDTAFPDANRLFTSPPRADGSEKWVDFVAAFWHCECVCGLSEKAFTAKYQKWCKKHGYNFSEDKALDIYASACGHFGVMPKTDTAKLLVEQAISQLRATSAALAALKQEMQSLAASLPEYPVVMEMFGVGPALGPQLMAEIGDVRRFHSKKALVDEVDREGVTARQRKRWNPAGPEPFRVAVLTPARAEKYAEQEQKAPRQKRVVVGAEKSRRRKTEPEQPFGLVQRRGEPKQAQGPTSTPRSVWP